LNKVDVHTYVYLTVLFGLNLLPFTYVKHEIVLKSRLLVLDSSMVFFSECSIKPIGGTVLGGLCISILNPQILAFTVSEITADGKTDGHG